MELARTEEAIRDERVTPFSLSDAAESCAEAFAPLASAAGKSLEAEIADQVEVEGCRTTCSGCSPSCWTTPVKYCDPEGTIRLSLTRQGQVRLPLGVQPPARIWTPPSSTATLTGSTGRTPPRARSTGGYGIGLSTAKAIVTRHRGRITNRYEGGVITFLVTLPLTQRK